MFVEIFTCVRGNFYMCSWFQGGRSRLAKASIKLIFDKEDVVCKAFDMSLKYEKFIYLR